jgi:hypothetical protein
MQTPEQTNTSVRNNTIHEITLPIILQKAVNLLQYPQQCLEILWKIVATNQYKAWEPAIDGRSKREQQQRQKSEYLENVKTYIVKMHRQHTCWPNSRELTDSMTEANQNTSE